MNSKAHATITTPSGEVHEFKPERFSVEVHRERKAIGADGTLRAVGGTVEYKIEVPLDWILYRDQPLAYDIIDRMQDEIRELKAKLSRRSMRCRGLGGDA